MRCYETHGTSEDSLYLLMMFLLYIRFINIYVYINIYSIVDLLLFFLFVL